MKYGPSDIVKRTKSVIEGKDIRGRTKKPITLIMRELACGHMQAEPNGGRAKLATTAYCMTCAKGSTMEGSEVNKVAADPAGGDA